ncbi:hypothetical protein D3C73_1115550 [compost metagenome]
MPSVLAVMPTAEMQTSASSVSALPFTSTATFTPLESLVTFVTLAPSLNFMPRFSKDFWAALETSSSSTGMTRSTASTTVTSEPRAR